MYIMRKTIFSTLLLCLSVTMAWAEQVVIETQHVSMVLDVVKAHSLSMSISVPNLVPTSYSTCRNLRCSDAWMLILPMV